MLQAGGVGMLRLPRHSPVHGRVLQPALNAVRRRAALVPQRLKAAEVIVAAKLQQSAQPSARVPETDLNPLHPAIILRQLTPQPREG
jgi:hypothetical protein